MRKVGRILAFIVTAVLFFGAGAGALAYVTKQLPFQTETIDRSQPTLLESIQDISQFHAAVGNFEVVLDQETDVKWVPGFIAGERSLFVAAGTVNAYVDLASLGEGDPIPSLEKRLGTSPKGAYRRSKAIAGSEPETPTSPLLPPLTTCRLETIHLPTHQRSSSPPALGME